MRDTSARSQAGQDENPKVMQRQEGEMLPKKKGDREESADGIPTIRQKALLSRQTDLMNCTMGTVGFEDFQRKHKQQRRRTAFRLRSLMFLRQSSSCVLKSDHSSVRISELIEKYSVRSNMIFSVACLENFGASSFPGAIKPTKKFGLVGTLLLLRGTPKANVSFPREDLKVAYYPTERFILRSSILRMRLEALAGFGLDPRFPDGCGDVSSGFAFRVAGPLTNAACRRKPSITALVLGKNQGILDTV
ncbi:hypothetical protein ALC60_03825 [Trachymyrmex zeteki]|uniref:Uncharacterized protein n=1 Tax=Mycetomoellerius zeteki TaxID=64791 RepID=A0A151X9Z1_9HYME|nr:hypothetical protein ALC60_03825 [Trachymyrmex zeteki]